MLWLCVAFALAGIVYLVARGLGSVAERNAGLESLWSIVIIDDKMRLSLTGSYKTRTGYPVIRMERRLSPSELCDGFPWKVHYRLPDGSEDYGWYNVEGRWTNNPFWLTAVDLVEA